MTRPPYILADTHTHIYYHADTERLEQQIDRCRQRHIDLLFLPNVDSASISPVMATAAAYPGHCFAMLGLHPCSVQENYRAELDIMARALATHNVCAIGEIGIDLYWDKSTLAWQQDAFRTQIQWAKTAGLPIDIHCREAFDEVFAVLEELKDDNLYGIFHCFNGSLKQALRAINLGFKLGIGGVVTFKKAGLDAVVQQVSLEHLVLETDAPYLAPVPFRGKENESSYLHYIAEKVADLHQTSIAEVARITTQNAKDIFQI